MNVAELVTDAVIDRIQQFGKSYGLEPLDWRIVVADEVPLIDGAPLAGHDCVAVCEAWAEALGLREYSFDQGSGVRSWYSVEGVLEIEISTLAH